MDEVGLIHMVSKMYVIFSLQEAIVSDRAPSPAAEPLILSWSKSLPNKLYNFFSGNLFKPHKQEYLVTNSESLVFMAYLSLPPLSQVCILPGGERLGTAPCKLCSWVSIVQFCFGRMGLVTGLHFDHYGGKHG